MKEYKTRVACCVECPNLRDEPVTMFQSLTTRSYCLLLGRETDIPNKYRLPDYCPLPDVNLSNIEPFQETTNGN